MVKPTTQNFTCKNPILFVSYDTRVDMEELFFSTPSQYKDYKRN